MGDGSGPPLKKLLMLFLAANWKWHYEIAESAYLLEPFYSCTCSLDLYHYDVMGGKSEH